MSKFNYILGGDSITVFVDGNSYTINKQAPTYDLVVKAVKANDIKALTDAVNIRQGIANQLQKSRSTERVKIDAAKGSITCDGFEVSHIVSGRIFDMIAAGFDVKPMVRFLENCADNPSNRAMKELFGFVDACRLPITEDGYFLAYKRVRSDYKDVHSGTFDNSVGQVCEMPRNQVDEDKDRTCSAGLHFCSYDYLKSFGGERIMVLKINPRDVVAIPSDYNNSKGRTCRYEVVDEIPVNEYNLPSTPIADGFTTGYVDNSYDDDASDWDESYDDEGPLTILSEYEIEDMVDLYSDENWTVEELADYFDITVDDVNDILKAHDLLDNTPAVVPASVEVANGVKLTPARVKAIRKLLNKGETLASIARQFGVHPRSIARIRDGEAWTDV
jgi:hypothetical protein